jgi:hypothetical protein
MKSILQIRRPEWSPGPYYLIVPTLTLGPRDVLQEGWPECRRLLVENALNLINDALDEAEALGRESQQ